MVCMHVDLICPVGCSVCVTKKCCTVQFVRKCVNGYSPPLFSSVDTYIYHCTFVANYIVRYRIVIHKSYLTVNTILVSFRLCTLHLAMATTFLPGLTGVFPTSHACYYCLFLLSITQITTKLIHMHEPIITHASPLAAGSGSAHASLCSML